MRVFGIERLGALSDGVIAIAMTLLVLELKVPEALGDEGVLAPVLRQAPHFVGWAISFVFISVVWHEHHLVFAHARGVDTGFILIALVQLAAVAIVPFGSALVGDFPGDPDVVVAFSAILVFNCWAMAAVAAYLARSRHLHARTEAAGLLHRAGFHVVAGTAAAAAAVMLAHLHHPLAGAAAWLLVPALLVVHGARVRRAAPAGPLPSK